LGGDEFVILLDDVSSVEGAMRVANQVLESIEQITQIDGHPVRLSASIGLSSAGFKDKGGRVLSADNVLNQADHAMYRAKQQGKGRICLSDDFASNF
jgi:diguanylate cyclase (GGDEF)-like protein